MRDENVNRIYESDREREIIQFTNTIMEQNEKNYNLNENDKESSISIWKMCSNFIWNSIIFNRFQIRLFFSFDKWCLCSDLFIILVSTIKKGKYWANKIFEKMRITS